ncbi:efflux RND transporter permease subunit [Sedimentisphaera salicampi]|uniref:Swarming motility protein SwrC n=1 Tax=Sedimentisphaera salicampi TaxID=1941349 RepID=A0A1W6LNN4_9BACT|nr:efflux RND transporter permease subunit [Sedimentisphaera salicampi]ARN57389.1 Swarming motility protein SwrC [Sedimentisphaera salicampi]
MNNSHTKLTGPIAWMAKNHVVANLLMIVFLVGGFLLSSQIKQEVFPEFDLDRVTITVPYPGASPEEVEQGIVLVVEEAVRGLDGVKEITANASEGVGVVTAELLESADQQKVYQDIQQEVDRIITFPDDAEEPEVNLNVIRRQVIDMQIYGDSSEWVLREVAEQVRDRLLNSEGITQVDLSGVRDYEIYVEIDKNKLRGLGLTLSEVSRIIDTNSQEIPCGTLRTDSGDILVRIMQRKDWADEFARIPIVTNDDGSVLYLRDIAEVTDTFEDTKTEGFFNGKRAVGINVFRIGKQTPIGVSESVNEAMQSIESSIPPGIDWVITRDRSDIYRQRLELLLKNAFIGLTLVLLTLGIFLEIRLAFWVTMGIPISFLGGLLFLPGLGVTINMISMFAFIISLGIVVDDAIVVGENIYEYRKRGGNFLEAAVKGAREVAGPVTFSIITNVVAFMPLMFVPGFVGKIWKVIPLVVSTVFIISLVEALFILPAHLSRQHKREGWLISKIHKYQQAFSRKYEKFITNQFGPLLKFLLRWRYVVIASGIAIFIGILGYVQSGRIGTILMPRVESDFAYASAKLPFGAPLEDAREVEDILVKAGRDIAEKNGTDNLSRGLYSVINGNNVSVRFFLTDADERPLSTTQVTRLWRKNTGEIPGLEMLRFEADRGGPGSGAAITVELSHRNIGILENAGEALAAELSEFGNVKDVDDGYTPGKRQYNFKIKPEGRSLGLTAAGIASQVRNAFYGAEAVRQQRGRNEVQVRVKYPESQRVSEYDIEQFLVRTPSGTDVPLLQVADYYIGRSYTTIDRKEGKRVIQVTANVEPISQTSKVQTALMEEILPEVKKDFPGLSYGWEGRQEDFNESMKALFLGLIMAVLCIYAVLAIPFRSYWQPVIVMMAIPFGIIGAVLGHILMGYSLSIMSMMGVVALAGVVVNDSLVLIDFANNHKLEGSTPLQAVHRAGLRRFRPIMLTTLTTFGGLAPMIFETSRQARFMIPMAISLGFGIVFATVITLILVPCLYVILDDVKMLGEKFNRFRFAEN